MKKREFSKIFNYSVLHVRKRKKVEENQKNPGEMFWGSTKLHGIKPKKELNWIILAIGWSPSKQYAIQWRKILGFQMSIGKLRLHLGIAVKIKGIKKFPIH